MGNKEDVPFIIKSTQRTTIVSLSILVVVLLIAFMGASIFGMAQFIKKEKTPEPIFYEVSKIENKIVRVQKGNLGTDKTNLLRDLSLRKYVTLRESINHMDDKGRWEKVRLYSSKEVYKTFYEQMNPVVNKDSIYANKEFTRKITVTEDYPIGVSVGGSKYPIHRVEFEVQDKLSGEALPIQSFVAIIRYEILKDYSAKHKDRHDNILGVRVLNYQITTPTAY